MSRQSLKAVSKLIDLANKEVPPQELFLSNLKRSIEIDDEKGKRTGSKTFKPSQMNCRRASYYILNGVEVVGGKSSYNMVGICNSGTDIHGRIQTAVAGMKENKFEWEYLDVGKYVESQHKKGYLKDIEVVALVGNETKLFNKKYNMSFMCDGIIRNKDKLYILEIKTEISGKWFERRDVDRKHFNQGIAYALNFNIDDVIFLYINRENLDMKTYLFHVTSDMRQSLIDYMDSVNDYVEKQIVPPKEENPRVCRYCQFSEMCRKQK